jgi:hypothetical protein
VLNLRGGDARLVDLICPPISETSVAIWPPSDVTVEDSKQSRGSALIGVFAGTSWWLSLSRVHAVGRREGSTCATTVM